MQSSTRQAIPSHHYNWSDYCERRLWPKVTFEFLEKKLPGSCLGDINSWWTVWNCGSKVSAGALSQERCWGRLAQVLRQRALRVTLVNRTVSKVAVTLQSGDLYTSEIVLEYRGLPSRHGYFQIYFNREITGAWLHLLQVGGWSMPHILLV